MEHYTKKSKQERIAAVTQSCLNALGNPEFLSLMAIRSYTEERIRIGLALAERAQELYENNLAEYGDSFAATEVFNRELNELIDEMIIFRGIARVVFKRDKDTQNSLNLNDRIERKHDLFPVQSTATISNALEDAEIAARCAEFGFSGEKLTALSARIANLPELKRQQTQELKEAQASTRIWDQTMEELDEWYMDFVEVARFALFSNPQLLELLDIVVPS